MNLFGECFRIYLKYIIKEQRKKFGQMELYLLCFSIIHRGNNYPPTADLDKFQNAFRDSEQSQPQTTHLPQKACLCCCYMSGDFLIQAVITLLIAIAGGTRGSCSGSIWFTWPTGPKPGGRCIFGETLPGGSLGKSLQVTRLCHSNKAIWPVGPMYVKLCYSQCENVHLLALQRTGGKWEMWQHFCPASEPVTWAIQPSLPGQNDPRYRRGVYGCSYTVSQTLISYFGKLFNVSILDL